MSDKFTEIGLPYQGAGQRAEIVQVLKPLFLAAIRFKAVTGKGTTGMVLSTLGMSGMNQESKGNNLIVISNDWNDPVINDSESRERIAFLGHSVQNFFQINSDSIKNHKVLSESLESYDSLIVLTDSDGESICIACAENSSEHKKPEVTYKVRWSFGDPNRFLANLNRSLEQLCSFEAGDSASDLKQWIRRFEYHPPFTEEFEPLPEDSLLPGIKLHPHQETGVENWEARNWQGIFKMCTGAGKTIASLAGISRLTQIKADATEPIPPVVVSAPTQILADQWCKIISGFGFGNPLRAYRSSAQWKADLEPWLKKKQEIKPRFVVTTYKTLSDPSFGRTLARLGKKSLHGVWLADEMHNLSSKRLRDVMKEIKGYFPFRLGLSATPEIEGNDSATDFLLDYFGENPQEPDYCATYELGEGIKDGVLCHYRYYPIPAYLDPELGQRYLSILRGLDAIPSNSRNAMALYEERRKILRKSGAQLKAFEESLPEILEDRGLSGSLVYCPPGIGTYGNELSDEIDTDPDERNLLEAAVKVLRKHKVRPCSIIGETSQRQREVNLKRFESGEFDVICAIGCLDEGVDVPSIRTAIVLYSVDREKQFIQRRGRILRVPKDNPEKIASIYDIILLPHGSQLSEAEHQNLLAKEIRRYREFAKLADNRDEAQQRIQDALLATTNPEQENSEPITI